MLTWPIPKSLCNSSWRTIQFLESLVRLFFLFRPREVPNPLLVGGFAFPLGWNMLDAVQYCIGEHATQLGSPTILYGPQLSLTFGHVHPLFKKTHGFPMVAPTLLTAFSQRLGHVAMLLNRFFKSVATFFIATFLRCFVQSLRRVGVGGQRAMSPCLNCHLSRNEKKHSTDSIKHHMIKHDNNHMLYLWLHMYMILYDYMYIVCI